MVLLTFSTNISKLAQESEYRVVCSLIDMCTKSNVGCWNKRTLVESDGSIATGVSRQCGRGVPVDRKVMLMVCELRRFKMRVVSISETKWFGNAVCVMLMTS